MTRVKHVMDLRNYTDKQITTLKEQFLLNLEAMEFLGKALSVTHISRYTYNQWYEDDIDFRNKVDGLRMEITAQYQREAKRRAIEGVLKPIYYKGRLIDVTREYSDNLLMFELKRRDNTYRDNFNVAIGPDDTLKGLFKELAINRNNEQLPQGTTPETIEADYQSLDDSEGEEAAGGE